MPKMLHLRKIRNWELETLTKSVGELEMNLKLTSPTNLRGSGPQRAQHVDHDGTVTRVTDKRVFVPHLISRQSSPSLATAEHGSLSVLGPKDLSQARLLPIPKTGLSANQNGFHTLRTATSGNHCTKIHLCRGFHRVPA